MIGADGMSAERANEGSFDCTEKRTLQIVEWEIAHHPIMVKLGITNETDALNIMWGLKKLISEADELRDEQFEPLPEA